MSEQLTKSLIKKMFEKQDELNVHTNGPEWRVNKNLKWYRAIWTELAELIDYTNWKWWKQQDSSLKDIEMEVIDIWHFGMSDMLMRADKQSCTEDVFLAFKNLFEFPTRFAFIEVQDCAENLAYKTLQDHKFHLEQFIELCSVLNLNIEQIYKLYIGKNILNKFRQNNGYKEKKYTKIWYGQEDNIHLMKILEEVDIAENLFDEIVYIRLVEAYKGLERVVS
jgi:dimeric dUTPase (all-alpha-NTP-PPase superfamily)